MSKVAGHLIATPKILAMPFPNIGDRLKDGINQIRATTDTVALMGRMANDQIFKQFTQGICPVCNNFSPCGLAMSSDRSMGLWERPGENADKRQQLYNGRVWFEEEHEFKYVVTRAMKSRCENCRIIIEALEYLQPGW